MASDQAMEYQRNALTYVFWHNFPKIKYCSSEHASSFHVIILSSLASTASKPFGLFWVDMDRCYFWQFHPSPSERNLLYVWII